MIGVNLGDYKLDRNKNIEFIKIAHNCRRLDRSGFSPGNYEMNQFCDFHSFHDNVYSMVGALEKVYEKLFDQEANLLIKKYVQEFLELLKKKKEKS